METKLLTTYRLGYIYSQCHIFHIKFQLQILLNYSN